MKREFIKGLLPDIGEDILDQLMNEHGKAVAASKNTIATLTTERDGLQAQLTTANEEIQSYKGLDIDGIQAKAAEWETKYTTETQALREQLEQTNYGHAVEGAVGGMKFTSQSARKAFVAELTAKKLPLQEGKLLGLDDFQKAYQTSDPDAFSSSDGNPTPVATRGTGGGRRAHCVPPLA